MASSSRGESSDEDLYGDIDDMYLSLSETESIHRSQDTLMPDSQTDTPVPQTTLQDDSGSDMCDGEAGGMNDLDLYDDLIAEEGQQKIDSYHEMMKKFEEAMSVISQLETENRTLRESLNKQETSSKDIQRNFSSLLITAKGEINRKEKELNTLRKQLTNKQRTPGRYRNQRDTTTYMSSFTSIDSEFEPLCVSSPGQQKMARNGDKSPTKPHKDSDRPSRSGNNSTDRKRYDRDDRDRHRRRRSKSNDKEKNDSKKYDGRGKERSSLETHSPRRKSKYENETPSPDKRHSKSEKVLNKQSIAKDDVSGEIDKDRRKDDSRDRLRSKRQREKERDSRKEKEHSRDGVSEDLAKSSDKVTLKHNDEEHENFEISGVKDSGKETNVKIDLREKLRLKRSCNNQTESIQSNEKDHSSLHSSSKTIAQDRVNALQLKTLHDLNVLTCYSTSPSSVSNSKEKECRRKRTVKKEDLNAEKEFLEKLKISIKKNETATSKTSNDTRGKSMDKSSKLKKEKFSSREIISYSDASHEPSDAESITDIDMKIASEKYFTASDISSHKSMCETPVMSEINETSLGESCGVFSNSEVDMESDNIPNVENSIIETTENTLVNESNEMEIEDESVNWDKSQSRLLQNSGRGKAANIPKNDMLKKVVTNTQDDARVFEHKKTDVRNSFTLNSSPIQACRKTTEGNNLSLPVTIEESEPMEIQTSINENMIADSHKLQDISNENVETEFSHKSSNLDIEHNIEHTVKTSAEMSSSAKKKESPDTARRRSARLLSKSESSLNLTKSNVHSDIVFDTEVVTENKSEENETINNTSSAGETEPELNTSGNSSIRKLQRMDSKKGKKKRVRRCVTSETISCVTSVSDSASDIFNGISDETEELNFSIDDTETSDDNVSSESSGKLQNLVCTDKNCTIKMRHLHPKCSDEKIESHKLQRKKEPNTERELDKNFEKVEIDNTHQMEVENTELNKSKGNYGDVLLNSVNLETELETIHAKTINKVSNGTIEVTAEESGSGSSVSSSSSSSGSCSSSGSSDSESESELSDIEQGHTQAKTDKKNTEIDPTETSENNETGMSMECRNMVTDTTPVSQTGGKVFESDALGRKSTVENMLELKVNERELQVANEDFNQLIAKQDITKGDKNSTIEMEVTSEPINMDIDYNKISTETEQSCQISLTVGNDVSGPNLNSIVIRNRSNQTIQETAAEEHIECNGQQLSDTGNKEYVSQNVGKLVEKSVQQDDVNDESGLKKKDLENVQHVQSSNLTVMECNDSEKDNTANMTNTLATAGEEQRELLDSKNGKDSGKNDGNDKNVSSENESEGSFGSNIMSEKTDSLESGDESEVSDSDDSSGSSSSDDSTYSSSDESGTGTSWETYSSESDSEQEDVIGGKNTDKSEIGNKNENKARYSQNILESSNVIYAEKTGKREVNIEKKNVSSATESRCINETENMSKIVVKQHNTLDRENDKEKSDKSKNFDGKGKEGSFLETQSPKRKSKYDSETSSLDKRHSRSEMVLNSKSIAKDNVSGETDSLPSNEKDHSSLPSSSKINAQDRVNALQLKTLHDLNVLTCYSTSPSFVSNSDEKDSMKKGTVKGKEDLNPCEIPVASEVIETSLGESCGVFSNSEVDMESDNISNNENSIKETTEKTLVNESIEMEVQDESVNGDKSHSNLLQKTDHVNDYKTAEADSEFNAKIIPNYVMNEGEKCHNDRDKASGIPQNDMFKKFNDVIYAEKTGMKEVNMEEKSLFSATKGQCINETEKLSKIVVRLGNHLDRENLTQDEILSCNASQMEVDESVQNMSQDICSLEKSDVQDSKINENTDSSTVRNISCGPEEITSQIKTPENAKTTINVPGPSPDRSNLLQCLLNCVQNEFKGRQPILDKTYAEKQSVDSAVHESSKTSGCHEVSFSTPVVNNAEKIKAISNEKTEPLQGISTCSGNETANKSKEKGINEKLKESTSIASDSDKKEHEEMMVDKACEEDKIGINLSISSDESDSGESSSGLSTHPTDCSTCSSSGSSTDSGSETESNEELRKEDRRKKGINDVDQNRDLITTVKNKDEGHLKCQEMTVHNDVTEIRNGTERSNVTVKDSAMGNEDVVSIVSDVTEETITPRKDNPYWIADELPAFLLPQDSSKCSDENKEKENKNSPRKSSPVTEGSRSATPAVKFANLSPNKNKELIADQKIQLKPRTTALGVISSVIEGEKQLVNGKSKICKSLELIVSKPEKLKQPIKDNLKLKNKSEFSKPISSVGVKKKSHSDLSEGAKNSSAKLSTEIVGSTKKIESMKLKLESSKPSRQVGEKERNLKTEVQQHVDKKERPKSTNRNIQKRKVEAREGKEKEKGNKESTEAKENIEKAMENEAKADENQEKSIAKENVYNPLRRSPRKKPSQLSVVDSKTNKTCKVEKKNASEPVSERKSPRKRKDNLKMKPTKTSSKSLNKKSTDKVMNASKSVTYVDNQNKIDKECVVELTKSSSLVQEGSVDLSQKSSCDIEVKGREKKQEDMETNVKIVKKNSVERVQEKIKKTADTTSVVVKKSSKGEGSNSKQLPVEKDINSAKCHFRDTTRELSEKIMKLKVEQNMLKKELAEKQRREKDSLKLKINLTKPYDLKTSKDTKENMMKGKSPVPGSSKTGKTQPLKVTKATNGHDDLKRKTGITKTGSLNKNENLTFEEKLSDYEGHLSKSKSVSIKSKKSVVDPSMSLTVQTASLKTFTIPKVRTVRKGHDQRQKVAKVSDSKSESSIPKKSSSYLSSTSGKRPKESKSYHVVGNKNNESKADMGKSRRQQTKPHKRYISSDSESNISNTDSESEPDSSKSEDSDAIVKAIFGSSDSSGNSKKSITIADLRQTRSNEDTEDIVKETSQNDALRHNENEVFYKDKEFETHPSNEKSVKSKNKDTGMQNYETAVDKTEESKRILTSRSKSSESQGKKKDTIKDTKKINTKTNDSHKEENVKKKQTSQKTHKDRTKEEEIDQDKNLKEKHTSQKSHKDRTKACENDQGLRKSPRIKAGQSPYKMSIKIGENQDSRDTHSVQELRRSCRTPTKSEIVRGQSKNEIRYFEISDKNPILSKIVSPKKPKLDLLTDKASHHTSKSEMNTVELKTHTLNHTQKETKGVPILLLEESTMDGIDYHDDVTLDIGNHSKEEVIEEAEGGDESSENSETDQSVEEGELSDSEEDEEIGMSELRQSREASEKCIEVTPKKQKISLSKDTSGRRKISPVKFVATPETKSSYDGESSCKCNKSECIHTRLSISVRKQRKRYRSDSDTCSDSSLSRQRCRTRHDRPSGRKRSRSHDRIDSPNTRRRDKLDRKSPVHFHRRSPPRRRGHSRSRSTSPLRGRRKRSRSLSPAKSRFVRKERAELKSRHRGRIESYVESPRSNRRNRTGSREHSVSPGRSRHRSNRSHRESNSESATDFSGRKSNRKKIQSDMSDEDLSSEKFREKNKSLSDDYEESSDEENERFSKLKSEKSRGNAKEQQSHENSLKSESGRIRHSDRKHSCTSSGYKVRERRRMRSLSRSPIRKRKRFRSDSGSEVETDRFEVTNKSVKKKCDSTESPKHKRSRTDKSCRDSSNENFEKSRKR